MIKNILLLILVSATVYNEAKSSYRTNVNKDSKERRNLDELRRIVQVLNGDTGVDIHYDRSNRQGTKKLFEKHKILKLLQKKYPAEFNTNSEFGVRIHFIKNPEVLDHFVKKLRMDSSSSSSSSSDSSDNDRRYGNDVADIRRNAMFRVQDRSNEDRIEPFQKHDNDVMKRSTQNFPPSIEDQVTPFKPHFLDSDEKRLDKKDISFQYDDGDIKTKRFKVKSKDKKFKENNAKETRDIEEKSTWIKKNEDYNVKSKEKLDNDDWYKSNKKETTANPWDKPKKKKPKDNAWDSVEETPKPKRKPDINWGGDTDSELTKKSVWDSREKTKKRSKKKDQKGSRVQKKNKKLDNSEDVSSNKKTVTLWDEPKKKKKVDWDAPENKRDSVDNDWDKVGKDWGNVKNSWDSGKTSRSSWKPKKKNPDDSYRKPSYIDRNPIFPKYKGRDRGGSFRGRTPIPFVGKRGIYDEK